MSDRGRHYWHTPEARGGSERAFATHQGRLPRELALLGITTLEAANRYLLETCLPRFNTEFAVPAREEGSAFVPRIGGNTLADILREQQKCTVSADNCVRFEGRALQIPADRHRDHDVKAKGRVHHYLDGRLGVFPGREASKEAHLNVRRAPPKKRIIQKLLTATHRNMIARNWTTIAQFSISTNDDRRQPGFVRRQRQMRHRRG